LIFSNQEDRRDQGKCSCYECSLDRSPKAARLLKWLESHNHAGGVRSPLHHQADQYRRWRPTILKLSQDFVQRADAGDSRSRTDGRRRTDHDLRIGRHYDASRRKDPKSSGRKKLISSTRSASGFSGRRPIKGRNSASRDTFVARMCARGWLRLEPGEEDRRSHQITITEMGKALLRKSYPAWQQAQSRVAHKLGPDGVAALKSVVRKLRS
jgi:hypothetical protein